LLPVCAWAPSWFVTDVPRVPQIFNLRHIFWSDHMPRRVAPQTMKIEEEDEKEDEDDFLVSKAHTPLTSAGIRLPSALPYWKTNYAEHAIRRASHAQQRAPTVAQP
jgi:hypothetical protein